MKPSSAKQKGRKKQQEVAAQLRAFLNLPDTDIKSLPMGSQGVDIWMSGEAIRRLPLSIEVKCQESLNIWAALEQATDNTLVDTFPAVVFSRNRSENFVAMPFLEFLLLLEFYHVAKE
jgi:hypothetical protein